MSAAKKPSAKFAPKPREHSPFGHIAFKVTPDDHIKYKALAKAHGVSMIEFSRQAVEFAIENMDAPSAKAPKAKGTQNRTMQAAARNAK